MLPLLATGIAPLPHRRITEEQDLIQFGPRDALSGPPRHRDPVLSVKIIA